MTPMSLFLRSAPSRTICMYALRRYTHALRIYNSRHMQARYVQAPCLYASLAHAQVINPYFLIYGMYYCEGGGGREGLIWQRVNGDICILLYGTISLFFQLLYGVETVEIG
jgi:hypothetical protein